MKDEVTKFVSDGEANSISWPIGFCVPDKTVGALVLWGTYSFAAGRIFSAIKGSLEGGNNDSGSFYCPDDGVDGTV